MNHLKDLDNMEREPFAETLYNICNPAREIDLIAHIKQLQNALNLVLPELPVITQDFVISTIENSKGVVRIAEGGNL